MYTNFFNKWLLKNKRKSWDKVKFIFYFFHEIQCHELPDVIDSNGQENCLDDRWRRCTSDDVLQLGRQAISQLPTAEHEVEERKQMRNSACKERPPRPCFWFEARFIWFFVANAMKHLLFAILESNRSSDRITQEHWSCLLSRHIECANKACSKNKRKTKQNDE